MERRCRELREVLLEVDRRKFSQPLCMMSRTLIPRRKCVGYHAKFTCTLPSPAHGTIGLVVPLPAPFTQLVSPRHWMWPSRRTLREIGKVYFTSASMGDCER